jgi:signal peptidase I
MVPTLKVGDFLFVNKMRYSLRIPFTEMELLRIDDPARGDIITFLPPSGGSNNYVKRVVGVPGDEVRLRHISSCELASQELERDYSCDFSVDQEPRIAMLEFREAGSSEWKNFQPRELDALASRRELTDADDVFVLQPDMSPLEWRMDPIDRELNAPPVLFRESIPVSHFTVEKRTEPSVDHSICPYIKSSGCLIGEDMYMVMGDSRDNSSDSRYFGLVPRKSIMGKALLIYFSINWYDQVCAKFMDNQRNHPLDGGFLLPDFPPEKQVKYCRDIASGSSLLQMIPQYIYNTVLYRLPRMKVRWTRIGTLLE